MQMKKRLSALLLVVLAACALAVSACSSLEELSGGPYINDSTPIPTLAQPVVVTPAPDSGAAPPSYNVMDTYTNTITRQ